MTRCDLSGVRVTVMGLGLHGGGLATARWAARRGATVTVTDLRDEQTLAAPLAALPAGVRAVVGRHEPADFTTADLVIKNPAVPRSAPLLAQSRSVSTDIALFLAEWTSSDHGPLVAVTGTKGKSTTSSAIAHILRGMQPGARLGGNITVSPLDFIDELGPADPVVLELSSFQLGDLAWCVDHNGTTPSQLAEAIVRPRLAAEVAVVTTIMRDHQDYYRSMERYVADKRVIYHDLAPEGRVIFGAAGEWIDSMRDEAVALHGAQRVGGGAPQLVSPALMVPGDHTRANLALAAAAATHLGMEREAIVAATASFAGVPHRLELVGHTADGIALVNDTAATIPEAALLAVQSYAPPVHLVAGGTDKGLDLAPLAEAVRLARSGGGSVALLAGTATDLLLDLMGLGEAGALAQHASLEEAMRTALAAAREAGGGTVLLSPGCASFGMFRNEFHRGDEFRKLALEAVTRYHRRYGTLSNGVHPKDSED